MKNIFDNYLWANSQDKSSFLLCTEQSYRLKIGNRQLKQAENTVLNIQEMRFFLYQLDYENAFFIIIKNNIKTNITTIT